MKGVNTTLTIIINFLALTKFGPVTKIIVCWAKLVSKGNIIQVKCFPGGKFSRDVFRLDRKCEKLDRELIWRSFGGLAIKGPSYNPSQVAL